jgi:hypothetical protein
MRLIDDLVVKIEMADFQDVTPSAALEAGEVIRSNNFMGDFLKL